MSVEAQRHPSPRCIACPEDGGSLKTAEQGTNLLHPSEQLHSTPETSAEILYLIQN